MSELEALEPTLREAFETLRRWLDDEQDCAVDVGVPLFPHEAGSNGSFAPPPQPPGAYSGINIFRPMPGTPRAADDELATLAHEAGHWRSWKLGERPEQKAYAEAVDTPLEQWPSLPAAAKNMILGEEVAAWRHGRALLNEVVGSLPEAFWASYERNVTRSLTEYRKRLGIREMDLRGQSG